MVEGADDPRTERVWLLDPAGPRYWSDPDIVLVNLCGNFLPRNRIPGFLDHAAYDSWRVANPGVTLGVDECLIPVDGELVRTDLVAYYRGTAPLHRESYLRRDFSGYPSFDEPEKLGGGRAWTARFASFNERLDDLYYVVTLHDAGGERSFMAQLYVLEDPRLPVYAESVRRDLRALAETGETNTTYTGSM
jgi:hypothetical protein